ncbi:MAG: ATP-binding protein [Anaerolineales bacterium]|nr:ATP-binding protein [Anaerolineales bacterium]
MFDLFLNTAKLITSEDARKSASAILELIRRSPEWQKDICTLEASIKRSYVEQAILLSDLTTTKMENLHFDSEAITAFKVIFLELIRNAFEHGCKSDKDAVKIIIEITKTYVGLSIVNPKGKKFAPDNIIASNKSSLSKNPSLLRGRGLLLVKQLSDTLTTIENGAGIKAVVYSDRIQFDSDVFEGLIVITVKSGFYNPSLSERLGDEIAKLPQLDVILNFSDFGLGTDLSRKIIELNIKSAARQKIIAIINDDSNIMLPSDMVAYTWREALQKLDKIELKEILPPQYQDPEFFSGRFLVDDEDDIQEPNIIEENGVVGYCPLHGPYDPTLGKCPFPHRQILGDE